ncbi:MAG TPA: hypothetical protein VLX58_07490 [Bryobacteraceae bacterium]|nr:hypothetical protein [Bryobacteraceae bacterium]
MWRRLALTFFCAGLLLAQKYNGPQPEKPDLPYIVHADNLVPTEVNEAKEESRKDEITYVIEGATSPAATPLASPVFLIRAEQLVPEKLEIYRLEVKNGRREVLFSKKKKQTARPVRCNVSRVGDNLYKLEVDEGLPNGEYSITPEGSNQVFCFRVY